MLLEAGKPEEALAAFEATMKKEPNRFRGIYGGARAAETLGDRAKATAYYRKLLEVAKDADTERPGGPAREAVFSPKPADVVELSSRRARSRISRSG